jgi:hypothetical protein
LGRLSSREVSGFLLKAISREQDVLSALEKHHRDFEKRLETAGVKNQRLQKNYAQIMTLIVCLSLATPITQSQRVEAMDWLTRLAVDRERELSRDHVIVERFWDAYNYLNGVPEPGDDPADSTIYEPRLNHSRDPNLIAVNLNHFIQVAAEHRQQVPDLHDLKKYLGTSRAPKFVAANVVVSSAVNARYNADRNPMSSPRPQSIRCWVFKTKGN